MILILIQRLDYKIIFRFNTILSYLFFSLVGSFEILAGLLFFIVLFRRKILSFFIFIPLAGAHIIELIGKSLMNHPGPPFLFLDTTWIFSFLLHMFNQDLLIHQVIR